MKKIMCLMSILSLVVLTSCGKKDSTAKKDVSKNEQTKNEAVKKEETKVKYIKSDVVQKRKMNQIFTSDAILVPKNKVDHRTEKGGTIVKILKKNGDTVKKGEVVMRLSDPATEAAYNSARSTYGIASTNYNKFKTLYNKKLISYLEFSPYENSFAANKASYDSAKGDYEKLLGKSLIDGVVGNIFDKEGNKIESSNVLFTVIDDSTMESWVGFPAEWLDQIKLGLEMDVNISALNGSFKGKVIEINPIADNETKKYKIKISVDNNDKRIKDGMYATVTIPIGEKEVLSVPDESIFIRNLVSYVYKIVDGKVTRVAVTTGTTNLPYTEITSDSIKEGDKVVVEGLFGLTEGDTVEEAK